MTNIEDRLPEILAAQADRYEVPVFSAQSIAENAVRKGFWRQRRFLALVAVGLLGSAGAGGALVAAGGGAVHDRVTVTFQDTASAKAGVSMSTASEDAVRSWIHGRITAEGLRGVQVTVRRNPLTVAVTGRASDVMRLRMLGMPAGLILARAQTDMSANGKAAPRPNPCVGDKDIGPALRNCDDQGHYAINFAIGDSMADGAPLSVAAAHAERRGPGPEDWAVVAQLDAAGTRAYSAFTTDLTAARDWLLVYASPVNLLQQAVTAPVRDGVIEGDAGFTRQQAEDFAVDLLHPAPSGVFGLEQVGVAAAPRAAD